MLVSQETIASIGELCQLSLPQEAVGLLWQPPGIAPMITQLKNISEHPDTSYEVDLIELSYAAEGLERQYPQVEMSETDILIWHSHPSGSTGPSRRDMQIKQKFFPTLQCMVMTQLTDTQDDRCGEWQGTLF